MARSHRPPTERPPVTAGSSRPSPAARVAPKLRKPLICRPFPMAYASGGIAGVGTFPGWLSLAVAPASKGLIPQPVSMSGLQCMAGLEDASRRASSGRVPRGARGAAYVMRGRPALAASRWHRRGRHLAPRRGRRSSRADLRRRGYSFPAATVRFATRRNVCGG
jgi:hypothetical protein